jgi:hypothetical protein
MPISTAWAMIRANKSSPLGVYVFLRRRLPFLAIFTFHF